MSNIGSHVRSNTAKDSTISFMKPKDFLSEDAQNRMKRRVKYDWKFLDFVYNFLFPLSSAI